MCGFFYCNCKAGLASLHFPREDSIKSVCIFVCLSLFYLSNHESICPSIHCPITCISPSLSKFFFLKLFCCCYFQFVLLTTNLGNKFLLTGCVILLNRNRIMTLDCKEGIEKNLDDCVILYQNN